MKKELKKFETHLIEEAQLHKSILKKLAKQCKDDLGVNLLKQKEGSIETVVKNLLRKKYTKNHKTLLKNDCSSAEKKEFNTLIWRNNHTLVKTQYNQKYKATVDTYEKYRHSRELLKNMYKWL